MKEDRKLKALMTQRSRTIRKSAYKASAGYVIALSALFSTGAWAQMQAPQQGARAQQIPLSTREQGNASVQQQAGTAAGASVNTVQSMVNISGRYQGSTLDPSASSGDISLSFNDAIQRGLRFNLGGLTATNQQSQVRSQRLAALSQLLPNVNGTLSQTVAQIYLPSEGITSSVFGSGFKVPDTTGQFHYYTLQGSLNQDAFDLTAFHNLKSAEASGNAAKFSLNDARELVILGVGGTYIQGISAEATVQAQRKEIALAEASYKQAAAQHGAGTRANIDADRSEAEWRTEQQRLASDEAELSKQKIRLARLIGLSPGANVSFSSRLPESLADPSSLEEAIARGISQRSDLKAAEQQMQAAVQARKAAQSEYLPTVSVNGNYGLQGTSADVGRVTYTGVASLNIPIWQGGRVKVDTGQANAVLAQRRAEYNDQRTQVEADIRIAFIDLDVAMQQVKVARENQALAADTLRQAQDRFNAGVTDSVEVVQSQESLSSADRDYISSLYAQTLARLHLMQATGDAQTQFSTLLEGAN